MNHKPKPLPKAKRSTCSGLTWLVCSRCGLVYLRNAVTDQAVRASCPGLDDQ